MYHSLIIYSPVEGYLGCFQFGIITNTTSISICVQVLCGCEFSKQLDEYLRV